MSGAMWGAIRDYLIQQPLINELGPVGRQTMRGLYQRRFATALGFAAAMHVTLMAGGAILRQADGEVGPGVLDGPRVIELGDFFLRPPAESPRAPANPAPNRAEFNRPKEGIPIPTPAPQADGKTIASQWQNLVVGAEIDAEGIGDGEVTGVPDGVEGGTGVGAIDGASGGAGDRPDPGEFIPVEKNPVLVESPAPVYPELARMAQIEGTVHVRALVGKDGKVKEAFVLNPGNDLLDRAALEAVASYVFLPAMQNQRPVVFWVTIPFRFVLN
jgi:TonB family protein